MSSRKRESSTNNAFSVLMGGKKFKKKTKSSFVLCPAGCGKHIAENNVNQHLDKCFEQQQEHALRMAVTQDTTPEKEPIAAPENHEVSVESIIYETSNFTPNGKPPAADKSEDKATLDEVVLAKAQESSPDTTNDSELKQASITPEHSAQVVATTTTEETAGPDTFSHMMQQSKRIFSQKSLQPLKQTVYLRENGHLVLTFEGKSPPPDDAYQLQWSTTVQVKDRSSVATPDGATPREIELTLGSFLPSHGSQPTRRLVRKHSRLSVPVLKSILQKCIRRRRPLPAVRVAMELMDKSMGDLLRRLPVIVLEDSSLHPDMALLTWLMVAYSKDFILPNQLVVRVLQIVYEVASNQWSDPLVVESSEASDLDQVVDEASLSSLHGAQGALPTTLADTMLWGALIRAEYGGMKCDVRMLRQYAALWKRRFTTGKAHEAAAKHLVGSPTPVATGITDVEWSDVPARMHYKAKEQSIVRVTPLCETGIDSLTMDDICIEGVDFHCSAVVDHLLSDEDLVGLCHDLLVLSKQRDASQLPATAEGRRSWLEGIFKRCMWTFSSGVNRRRHLPADIGKHREEDSTTFSNMWYELLAPRAKQYQERYVKDRLAR